MFQFQGASHYKQRVIVPQDDKRKIKEAAVDVENGENSVPWNATQFSYKQLAMSVLAHVEESAQH